MPCPAARACPDASTRTRPAARFWRGSPRCWRSESNCCHSSASTGERQRTGCTPPLSPIPTAIHIPIPVLPVALAFAIFVPALTSSTSPTPKPTYERNRGTPERSRRHSPCKSSSKPGPRAGRGRAAAGFAWTRQQYAAAAECSGGGGSAKLDPGGRRQILRGHSARSRAALSSELASGAGKARHVETVRVRHAQEEWICRTRGRWCPAT